MMDYSSLYTELSSRFRKYAQSFHGDDPGLNEAVQLKTDHTSRVCDEITTLSKSIDLDQKNTSIAQSIALLHDLGRFEQFKKYRTFADRKSINHAELAVSLIDKFDILKDFSSEDSNLIKTAVLHHNARALPDGLNDIEKLFCGLIRDADKLDIFTIAVSRYLNHDTDPLKSEIFEIGIPDKPIVTTEVCECVGKGLSVDFGKIRSLNDFKLIQIGWIYDLNFQCSFRLIKSRGHFDIIKGLLPQVPEVLWAVGKAEEFLNIKAGL